MGVFSEEYMPLEPDFNYFFQSIFSKVKFSLEMNARQFKKLFMCPALEASTGQQSCDL